MDPKDITLLIAEDEVKLGRLLKRFLEAKGYQCYHVERGDLVEDWLANNHADLLLLDIMMPGKDGFDVCRDLRKTSDIPIMMLTARVEQVDEMLGLDLGADDYICKPYELSMIETRVRANLRRCEKFLKNKQPSELIELSQDELRLKVNEHIIQLTSMECRLMSVFIKSKGRVFSRDQLLDLIHDDHRIVTDRTIDTLVKAIRKKISAVFKERALIHSIYGMGYKFEV